jgi:hypothetical protein
MHLYDSPVCGLPTINCLPKCCAATLNAPPLSLVIVREHSVWVTPDNKIQRFFVLERLTQRARRHVGRVGGAKRVSGRWSYFRDQYTSPLHGRVRTNPGCHYPHTSQYKTDGHGHPPKGVSCPSGCRACQTQAKTLEPRTAARPLGQATRSLPDSTKLYEC